MSKFESSIKQIAAPQQKVYDTLADLRNLEALKERFAQLKGQLPADEQEKLGQLKDVHFDADSIAASAPMVGEIKLRIIDREPPKTIKFASEQSPVSMVLWIQLLPVTAETSKMRLTIDADIPFFLKGMVQKPLQEGIEKIADALAMVPYGNIE